MQDALRITRERIEEVLPNAQLTAHQLLRAIYCDDNFALALRFRAAEACLPYEKPRLSATAVLDTGNEGLAARLKAAQQRVGVTARDILALGQEAQAKADAADAALSAPITLDLAAEAAGAPNIIEGTAELVPEQVERIERPTAPTSMRAEDYI